MTLVDKYAMKESFYAVSDSITYIDLCDNYYDETIIDIKFNGNKIEKIIEIEKYIGINLREIYHNMGLVVFLDKESGNNYECLIFSVTQPKISNYEFAISIGD